MLQKPEAELGAPPVSLAPLGWEPSPNYSSRNGAAITHLVWHATAGAYGPSCRWLCQPQAQASAHIVIREDGEAAMQLVALEEKAWHAVAWNGFSIGVEHASLGAGFASQAQLRQSARVFAWLCHRYSIPPLFGLHRPRGIVRHRDLGLAGGGHSDGPSDAVFTAYLARVQLELERGGFRNLWAR